MRRRRLRLPWWLWTILGLGAAVGTVAALGGFEEVPIAELPIIELGDVHHGTQLDTVITAAYLSHRAPGQEYDVDEGEIYIVVEATLLNTTNRPVHGYDAVRIVVDGAVEPTEKPYGLIELRRGDVVGPVQPGLPVAAAYTWVVGETSVSAGDEIRIGLFETFAVDDNLILEDVRTAPTPTARIVATLGEEP